MKPLATALGAATLLLAPLAAQAQFTVNWAKTDSANAMPSWFSPTGGTERALAYGVVGGVERLYVVDRDPAVTGQAAIIRIIDPATGSDVGTFTNVSNSTVFGGGGAALNDIGVTTDGKVIACNLATGTTTTASPFKCYRWDSETAAPVNVLDFSSSDRLGDRVTITGSCTDNTATIWTSSNSNPPRLYSATSTDNCATFTMGTPVTASVTGGNQPTVTPIPGSTDLYVNNNSINPTRVTSSGALVSTVTSMGITSSAMEAFTVGTRTFLSAFVYNTTGPRFFGRIVETTSSATGTVIGSTATLGNNANGNGSGDIDARINHPDGTVTLFVLASNNGIAAFTTTAVLPVELVSFTAAASGTDAVVRWTTASETNNAAFAVEALRGSTWTELASVAGRGTTSERADYQTRVSGLGTGRHTLRLVQRDLDGTATVAGTVELVIGGERLTAEARGTSVRFSAPSTQVLTVEAFDVLGRRVAVLFTGSVEAGSVESVELSGVASGVYVVRVSGRTGVASTTAVVR